jgi:hypothetical protein
MLRLAPEPHTQVSDARQHGMINLFPGNLSDKEQFYAIKKATKFETRHSHTFCITRHMQISLQFVLLRHVAKNVLSTKLTAVNDAVLAVVCRWIQKIPPKRRYLPTKLNGDTFQKALSEYYVLIEQYYSFQTTYGPLPIFRKISQGFGVASVFK